MVIFNASLIIFSGYFVHSPTDPSSPYGATDIISDEDISGYQEVGRITSFLSALFGSAATLFIIGTMIVGSAVIGWFTGGAKNLPLALGIGIFLGMVIALFNATSKVFMHITENSIVGYLITLIFIIIGLVTIWTVAEMFMGSRGVDA